MSADGPYYLGIDGGGTRCRARLRGADGQLIGEAEGGLCNIYQDFDGALKTLLATARMAAGKVPLERIHAGLGLAGATGPQQCARVKQAGLPFASVNVDSDGFIAFLGAHGGEDGAIVIAGTGSAGFALVNGRRLTVGGHGFLLGDHGSGAVMGRALLECALLAHDGIAASSGLTRAVMAEFDDNPSAIIEWSRAALSRDYAAFTPRIFASALEGDSVASAIVQQAAQALANIATQLRRAGTNRLSLLGGVGAAILPYLPAELAESLQVPRADAVDGAIFLARGAMLSY